MRRWFAPIFVLLAAACVEAEEPLNLLFIGNSYTQGYMPREGKNATFAPVPEAVARLAVADGHPKPRVLQVTTGGKPLDFHLKNATTQPAKSVDGNGNRPWTHMVLQDLSTRPADKVSKPESVQQFHDDVAALVDLVRAKNPAARVVLYQTWARRGDAWMYPEKYGNPAAMQADLNQNYAKAAADLNAKLGVGTARVAPVGTAFGLLNYDAALYNPDGTHSTPFGYRLSAMVLYRTIYDETVGDISYDAVAKWINLTPEQFKQLQDVADRVEIPETNAPGR